MKNKIPCAIFPGAHFATQAMVALARAGTHFPDHFSDEDIAFLIDSCTISDLHAEIDRLRHELATIDEAQMHPGCW